MHLPTPSASLPPLDMTGGIQLPPAGGAVALPAQAANEGMPGFQPPRKSPSENCSRPGHNPIGSMPPASCSAEGTLCPSCLFLSVIHTEL